MSLEFFVEAMKRPFSIGSITPSSRFLVRRLLRNVNICRAKCIVELGPGTGAITNEMLPHLSPSATLVCFEKNSAFYAGLRRRIHDPRVCIVNETAENLARQLNELELSTPGPDYIISSLPLTNLPREVEEKILSTVHDVLAPHGAYIQYQYLAPFSLQGLRRYFPRVTLDLVVRNIPPAWVYECRK